MLEEGGARGGGLRSVPVLVVEMRSRTACGDLALAQMSL